VIADQDEDVGEAERSKTSRQSKLGRFVDNAVVESALEEEGSAQVTSDNSKGRTRRDLLVYAQARRCHNLRRHEALLELRNRLGFLGRFQSEVRKLWHDLARPTCVRTCPPRFSTRSLLTLSGFPKRKMDISESLILSRMLSTAEC
jgi:hypothetical protein